MNKPSIKFKSVTNRFIKHAVTIAFGCSILFASCNKKDDDPVVTPTPVPENTSPSAQDIAFVQKVAMANTAEVQLGEIAVSRAENPSVKAFGEMMASEHGMAQGELRTLAQNKGITISTTLDSAHTAMKNLLMTLEGRMFDSTYIAGQVMDHQKTQADFQLEKASGRDENVKGYANKYLPHINMHFEHAKKIQDSLF